MKTRLVSNVMLVCHGGWWDIHSFSSPGYYNEEFFAVSAEVMVVVNQLNKRKFKNYINGSSV